MSDVASRPWPAFDGRVPTPREPGDGRRPHDAGVAVSGLRRGPPAAGRGDDRRVPALLPGLRRAVPRATAGPGGRRRRRSAASPIRAGRGRWPSHGGARRCGGWSGRTALGVFAGSIAMLALGGFVPVIRGWLRDEIDGWAGIVEALGGVRVVTKTSDPDGDLGPVLARADAPRLFDGGRRGLATAGSAPPRADPADVPALLRRGRLGAVAGPGPGPPPAPRAEPGRAPRGAGARAGAPGAGRRDPGGAIGAVRRGARPCPGALRRRRPVARPAPRLGAALLARDEPPDRADRARPGGPRRPLGRHHRRRPCRLLGAGQGRDGAAPLPRGPRPLRSRSPRRPQPLRLLPRLLVSPPGRGPLGDAAPDPGQRPRDGRPRPTPPCPTASPSSNPTPTPARTRPTPSPPPPCSATSRRSSRCSTTASSASPPSSRPSITSPGPDPAPVRRPTVATAVRGCARGWTDGKPPSWCADGIGPATANERNS